MNPSGIDLAQSAPSIRPQDDFYRHVNGTWLEKTAIRDDRSLEGTFTALRDSSEEAVRTIIEDAASRGQEEGGLAAQIGGLYASFMDEERLETLGLAPLRARLDALEELNSPDDVVRRIGELFRAAVPGLFYIYPSPDAGDPTRVLAYLGQSGLGLPDESYYREEQFGETVSKYQAYLADLFSLAGRTDPSGAAERIVALERRIAAAHWDKVTLRDPQKTYNLRTADEVVSAFPLAATWFGAAGIAEDAWREVVLSTPDFFPAMVELLNSEPVETWREWLAAKVLDSAAPYLSRDFVQTHFAFHGTVLSGTPELKDRWKRGVAVVEDALGEAIGELYVREHFPESHKARMQELVSNLVEAYRESITGLDWMGEETKEKALAKLAAFRTKIGYPEKWIDYSAVVIDPMDLIGNVERAHSADVDRHLDEIGKPVDLGKWLMTPQTVNAYYHPVLNEIVFPAAILQPPFFQADSDDAVNYGAIGAVIGHEIGHGFDDKGSQYDGDGALRNWWTDADREAFEARTGRLVDQFNVLEPSEAPGHPVNGELTLGENIGDLGGLGIAFKAYQASLDGAEAPVLDGLSGAQRFFFAWATGWRQVIRSEEAIRRVTIDPHSPNEFRANAIVKNLDAFHEAFGVSEGDGMWLAEDERVRIW
ncbi:MULTISPECIES: M13-type metalloendopeptidase [Arthrobacter]|uniref:M13-type metalloendopeptidase n=2 Tax=Arthrobacter TaxID=1663 RepID=A0ABU9KGK1_9MICC|nr:M13-type metalloendopeptidase [Arthrobacter sp. YJM1]MDP5226009.1 M13-type metalloendopeptidase [Arthrobacter sp. YJM1]